MKKSLIFLLLLCSILLIGCSSDESELNDNTITNLPTQSQNVDLTEEITSEPTEEITNEPTVTDISNDLIITDIEITEEPTEIVTPEPTISIVPTPEITEEPTPELSPEVTPDITNELTEIPTTDPTPTEKITSEPEVTKSLYEKSQEVVVTTDPNQPTPTSFLDICEEVIVDGLDTQVAYPNNDNVVNYCIENVNFGVPMNKSFIFRDVSYTLDTTNLDEIVQYGIDNKLYINNFFNICFTDLYTYNALNLNERIYNFIDHIQIGDHTFTTEELLCSTKDIKSLYEKLLKIYKVKDEDIIYHVLEESNEYFGKTYYYQIPINDIEGEYTKEDLDYLYENGYTPLTGKILITIYENPDKEVVWYDFKYTKTAHFVTEPFIDQNGYDYNKIHIGFKDGATLGTGTIEIIMHNNDSKIFTDQLQFYVDLFIESKANDAQNQ